jgi:hypothetical protein
MPDEDTFESSSRTLVATDYRCLEHVDFKKGNVLANRVQQRDIQPENSDRLRVLIDQNQGILRSEEFSSRKDFVIKEGSQKASIADILKVHEYTYIEKFRK